ncbi:reverse transcriptase domain-containing protein [Tanacetum coccineum]
MDSKSKLPRSSSGCDAIWVIVDRLTKLSYFLAIQKEYKMEYLARLFVNEAVARHGVHVSSIPDRDGMYIKVEIEESKMIGLELEQETTKNGNSKKRISTRKDGVVRVLPPVSAAKIQAVEKERKARTILLMAIPKEHLRRFHGMDDAKEI